MTPATYAVMWREFYMPLINRLAFGPDDAAMLIAGIVRLAVLIDRHLDSRDEGVIGDGPAHVITGLAQWLHDDHPTVFDREISADVQRWLATIESVI